MKDPELGMVGCVHCDGCGDVFYPNPPGPGGEGRGEDPTAQLHSPSEQQEITNKQSIDEVRQRVK